MSVKSPSTLKRRKIIYIITVITLSLATAALLFGTFFSRLWNSGSSIKAGNAVLSQLSDGFNCTADVSFDGNEYEVNIQKPSGGDCTMTFVKPAELSSLSFEQDQNGLKVKFGTLVAEVDPSSIPQSSIFNAVMGTFNSCAKDGVSAKENNGEINISGNSPAGAYTIALGKDLKPTSLSIPSIKMNVTFKDFQYTK